MAEVVDLMDPERVRQWRASSEMLKREWDGVQRALGSYASPGLTPSRAVEDLVYRVRVAILCLKANDADGALAILEQR